MSKVTIVSALYYIGREKWKYSAFPLEFDRYKIWVKNILSLDSNIIIFTDEYYYEHINNCRKEFDPELTKTKIIKMSIGELELYKKYYNKMSCVMSSPEFKKIIQFQVSDMYYPFYNVIMYNKINFIEIAESTNPFNSEYFFWMDAGALRNEIQEYKNVIWPDTSIKEYFNDKITFFSHYGNEFNIENQLNYFLSQTRVVQGGYFIVPKHQIKFLKNEIYKIIDDILENGYIGSDEKILDLVCKKNLDKVNMPKSTWFEFYNLCKFKNEKTKIYLHLKELSKDNLAESHANYLHKLKNEFMFNPKIIYDIGACVLNWTNCAKNVWPDAEYFLFDATEELEDLYKETNHKYQIAVLSNENNREVTFYKNVFFPWGNSYYKENPEFSHRASELFDNESNQFKRRTLTVDLVRKNRNFPYPDLIKIDVQGCELDILKGATDTIKNTEHLIIELQHVPYNIGANLYNDVIPYIESIGFELVTPSFSKNVADSDYHFKRKK